MAEFLLNRVAIITHHRQWHISSPSVYLLQT